MRLQKQSEATKIQLSDNQALRAEMAELLKEVNAANESVKEIAQRLKEVEVLCNRSLDLFRADMLQHRKAYDWAWSSVSEKVGCLEKGLEDKRRSDKGGI